MTDPAPRPRRYRQPPVEESPYASVRELYAMENRMNLALTAQLGTMESRLIVAISNSDKEHARIHDEMTKRGEERHKPISEFMQDFERDEETKDLAAAKRAGVRGLFTGAWKAIVVLDAHWRVVALILAAVGVFLGNLHLSIAGAGSGN